MDSKKISYPLAKISGGIDRLKAGDYTVRLDFKLESEFLQIRDTLNGMAEKLEWAGEQKSGWNWTGRGCWLILPMT